MVPQRLLAADLEAQDYPTLNEGETLTVTLDGGTVLVEGATVVTANIEADNGVVHIIDAVVNTTAPPAEETIYRRRFGSGPGRTEQSGSRSDYGRTH